MGNSIRFLVNLFLAYTLGLHNIGLWFILVEEVSPFSLYFWVLMYFQVGLPILGVYLLCSTNVVMQKKESTRMEDRKSIHTYIISNLVLLVPCLFLLVRALQTKKYFWQLEAALTGNVVWYCTEVCLILLWKQDSLLPSKFRGFTSKHE